MYKKLLSISVLALSFSLAQSNVAFAHKGHHCDRNNNGYKHAIEKLDLTADQQTKIKDIVTKANEKVMHDRVELKAIHKEAREEYMANTMDESKIDKFVDKKLPYVGDIMKVRMKERLEISHVLTDAQKAKVAQMLAKHAAEKHNED